MIKQSRVDGNDVRISTFMICVADNALASAGGIESPMESEARLPVLSDFLVAGDTQSSPCLVGLGIVTSGAVTFGFSVPLDHPTGHHESAKILRLELSADQRGQQQKDACSDEPRIHIEYTCTAMTCTTTVTSMM